MSASQESQNCIEESNQLPTPSQGYVLPEGKIMPHTVFVGEIDIRMNEAEIRSFFARYGTVKEVKIIMIELVCPNDVQKIVETQINFHGKKLKLGAAIRRHPNLCAYHVPPGPVLIIWPTPQFHSVWKSQETYMQPPAMMSPITQYVQVYPYGSPALVIQQQVPVSYQPTYNYLIPSWWPLGETRNYIMPPGYTTVNYGGEMDAGTDQAECSMADNAQPCANHPQKESLDRGIQTVVLVCVIQTTD
ncbi:hypothetical protein JRQ81_019433 [Phrynocephalus forsythii]|uniref:RRM domain-containing protein n=1 Tax=Phrynocephalus forsythii TaxID=171643 RepID=A0A9Q0XNY5_9SAUR|nr:hypothetical protein JRQ81_019433 [Phrynocephalus forsythii]